MDADVETPAKHCCNMVQGIQQKWGKRNRKLSGEKSCYIFALSKIQLNC